ncbi:hypothetical protein GQR58_030637 [Nymphon striatum]|nr:hypothetical protein GQR58_030637 [Nymphon striatum]
MELTVYPARRIRTMNGGPPDPEMPLPDTVVVAGDTIVEVGTADTVRPWLDAHPHTVDDTFADKVLMPGLIDPHLHPSLGATLLPTHFITAMKWDLPDGRHRAQQLELTTSTSRSSIASITRCQIRTRSS